MSIIAQFTGIDIDIGGDFIGGLEHEIYHFENSLPDIDVWPFDKGGPLEINVNDSIERINGAILDDPFGTIGTIALLMVPGGAPAWAFAVNSGASAAYRGGSTEDVIKAMGSSYLGAQASDIVSNQVSQQITNSRLSEAFANSNLGAMGSGPLSRLNDTAVINAISEGAGKAAETLIHTEGDLSAAVDSFLTGSTFSGLSTILGGIDDSLAEGSFSSLSPGIKNAITTAALAVVKGEDVTEATLNGFVEGYVEGVIPTVQEYIGVDLLDGTQMSDEHITLITNALASSLDAAIAGGADPTDAFFASFRKEANDRVKDWINSEEGLGVNKWFDDQLNNTEKLAAALNPYNEKKAQRAEQVVEYNRIAGKEKELFTAYEDATTEADKAAARQAVLDYRATDEFKSLTGIKTKIEQYEAELVPLYSAYNTAVDNMLSDIDEFGDEFKPISDLAAMTAAKALRPTFDEDQYKEVMGLEEDDTAALHYLENQAIGDIEIAKSIAGEYQDVILQLKNGDIDKLPDTLPGLDARVDKYGRPTMPFMPGFEGKPGIDTGQDGLKQGSPLTKQLAFELGYSLDLEGDTLQLYDLIELNKKGFFVNQLDLERAKLTEYEYGEDYNPKDDLVSINAVGEMSNDPVDTAAEVAAVNESNAQRIRDAAANITYEEYQNMSRSELEAAGLGERPIDRAAAFGMYNWKDYFKGGVKNP